jgi:hypothetical protein
MLAKVVRQEVSLDYTEVATPLTGAIIHNDLQEIEAMMTGAVGSIRMWEYQWDWLRKTTKTLHGIAWQWEFDVFKGTSGGEPRLWEIPVVFA